MAGRKVTIILEADFGHPGNNLTKEYVFENIARDINTVLQKGCQDKKVWEKFNCFEVTAIKVE